MERCIASEIGNLSTEQIEAVRKVLDRIERERGSRCAMKFDEPNRGGTAPPRALAERGIGVERGIAAKSPARPGREVLATDRCANCGHTAAYHSLTISGQRCDDGRTPNRPGCGCDRFVSRGWEPR